MSRLSRMILDIFQFLLEARIDMKNKGDCADLRIEPRSDSVSIDAPAWFSKGGIGYVVKSRLYSLRFEITCVKDGIFSLYLRGNDIRDEEIGKRIPVWIDYTKLAINEDVVFEEIIPTHHDKPYYYEKAVKDREKICLEVDWQPHLNQKDVQTTIEKLCSNYIHIFYTEGNRLCGNELLNLRDMGVEAPDNVHFSVIGICVSRDFVTTLEDKGYKVDRFVQDINPISLFYQSPLGGGRRLEEEDLKEYLVKPLNHFHLRNTLLDLNKTAYDYLFEVSSDYLILDVGCLRYQTMVDEKNKRGMTKQLLDRLHWSDSNGDFKELVSADVEEIIFRRYMDEFIKNILKHYRQERIIIVEVYRTNFYVDKSYKYIKKFGGNIVHDNRGIMRGYKYIRKAMPKAHYIPFISNVLGDENHKWGLFNLHFIPEYYEFGGKALTTILSGLDLKSEIREIENLRLEYEQKIYYKYLFSGKCKMGKFAISG